MFVVLFCFGDFEGFLFCVCLGGGGGGGDFCPNVVI